MRGIYNVSDGRFVKRLWDKQPMPQEAIDAGDVVVMDVPDALIDEDEASHTRWNGEEVVADTVRAQETADRRAATAAAQAEEAADTRSAWDAIATVAGLTAEQKAAFANKIGM